MMLGESLNPFRVNPVCIHVYQICPLSILKCTHLQIVLFHLQTNAECNHFM